MKVNGFQNNYMARRARLLGIIESNPNWQRFGVPGTDRPGSRCNISFAARILGYDGENSTANETRFVANALGLHHKTINNVVDINDCSLSHSQSVQVSRVYLLGKNKAQAKKLLGSYGWLR